MIMCSECYTAVCDFCKFYNFNGKHSGRRVVYVSRGWCKLLHKRRDPGDQCKRFHCFKAE